MWFRDDFRSNSHADTSDKLTEEELTALSELASEVVSRRLTVAAILALESVKPLNWIGSQSMIVAEPVLQPLLSGLGSVLGPGLISKLGKNYLILQRAFEKRQSIEIMIQKIEELDAEVYEKEKALKKARKKNRKGVFSRFKRNRGGDTV